VPTSKQARSRQARQKERLAIAAAKRQRTQRLRRRASAAVIVFVVIVVVFGIFVLGGTTHDDNEVTPAVTSPPTTAARSAKGKPCVARKGKLPKGAPDVPVEVGSPPTKLVTKDLKVGTGDVVNPGATVTAHYIGLACSTGRIFDSSWSQGQRAEFSLDHVIQGWTDGVPGMKVGGRRLLGIPSDQAYAASPQRPPGVAPDEALWFVVDVTKVA
jgi:peptidylprolyl isomerase